MHYEHVWTVSNRFANLKGRTTSASIADTTCMNHFTCVIYHTCIHDISQWEACGGQLNLTKYEFLKPFLSHGSRLSKIKKKNANLKKQ